MRCQPRLRSLGPRRWIGRLALTALILGTVAGSSHAAPEGPSEATREAILTGHALPREICVGVMLSRDLLVNAVYQATVLSGQVGGSPVKTGTLSPLPLGKYRYTPEPTDKLVVKFGTETHEFQVKHVEGNLRAATPSDFIMKGHALTYTHAIPGKMRCDIKLAYRAAGISVDVAGTYKKTGNEFKLDLRARGKEESSADLVGTTTKTTFGVEGTVRSVALRMLLTAKERHEIVVMTSKKGIPNRFQPPGAGKRMARSLTTILDVLDSTLRLGDDTYQWVDCHSSKTTWANQSAQWPGDFKDWRSSGVVRRNGRLYGRYDVVREGTGADASVCRFVLKTLDGPMDVDVTRR